MYVPVMQWNTKQHRARPVVRVKAEARALEVIVAIQRERQQALQVLLDAEIADREAANRHWWRRVTGRRLATDPDTVLAELKAVRVIEDDRYFCVQLLGGAQMEAAKAVLKAARVQHNKHVIEIDNGDWQTLQP